MKPNLPDDDRIDAFLREDSVQPSEHLNARLDTWLESLPASRRRAPRLPFAKLGLAAASIAAVLVSIFWIGPSSAPGTDPAAAVVSESTHHDPLDEELFALLDLVANISPTVFDQPDMNELLAGTL